MMSLPRGVWVALAVALAPQFAAAGPIEWSYKAEVQYAQDYGSRFNVAVMPGVSTSSLANDPAYLQLFTSTADPHPLPGEYEARYEFSIAVTITDEASGAARSFSFPGRYSSMWTHWTDYFDGRDEWRWEWEVSDFGDYRNGYDFNLGKNRYSVRAYGGANGAYPFGELAVSVQPLATPEPGTLVLSGLGLAAVGLIRARRR